MVDKGGQPNAKGPAENSLLHHFSKSSQVLSKVDKDLKVEPKLQQISSLVQYSNNDSAKMQKLPIKKTPFSKYQNNVS